MDIARYLARIGYSGPRTPSAQALRQLHRAHLFSIPFENLSIGWGEPIELSEVAHYWKMVECRRGGFCYEQNGLFAWALRELGYDVTLLAAEVWSSRPGAEGFGPEFSHLALRVDVDEPMLVDVGFGDSFINPIVMRLDAIHREPPKREYRITEEGGRLTLERRDLPGEFTPSFRFALTPRHMEQFESMCEFHQMSPESHFTQHRILSLARPDGRVTLRDRRYTEVGVDGASESLDLDEEESAEVIERQFGIVMPRAERHS